MNRETAIRYMAELLLRNSTKCMNCYHWNLANNNCRMTVHDTCDAYEDAYQTAELLYDNNFGIPQETVEHNSVKLDPRIIYPKLKTLSRAQYRGKTKEDTWVTGDYCKLTVNNETKDYIVNTYTYEDGVIWKDDGPLKHFKTTYNEVYPESVQRCIYVLATWYEPTLDEEGEIRCHTVMLYEGDIVKGNCEDTPFTGRLHYELGRWIIVSNDFHDGYIPLWYVLNPEDEYTAELEIVGNIFDKEGDMK